MSERYSTTSNNENTFLCGSVLVRMSKIQAQVVALKNSVPSGEVKETDFEILSVSVDSALKPGEVLFKALAFSADPYLRSRFKGAPGSISGFLAGEVVESANDKIEKGSRWGLHGLFQDVQVLNFDSGDLLKWDLTKFTTRENISLGVGALGMPGATAWGGLLDVIKPVAGETIFVSSATGAVGSLVVQMAAHVVGCAVIASAGGPEKCALAKQLGAAHTVDYKTCRTTDDVVAAIKACSPSGIDANFENVGGIIFDGTFKCLKKGGRVAVCGAISMYNSADTEPPNHFNVGSMIYSQQVGLGFFFFFFFLGVFV
jgi:NADPH-dependent curcumin reductase CurA